MASELLPQFLVGTTFGASLLLSGVSNPATIVSQFTLQDFQMLVAFLTASSVSAVVIYASNASGYAKLSPRSCSDYGWLGRYGGNVIGGVMQGIGMAISGACPGTGLVQAVMGWGNGAGVLAGGVLGGALFNLFGHNLRMKRTVKSNQPAEVKTFQEKVGITTEQMVVIYELMMAGVIASTSLFAPMTTHWRNALLGGCLIGVAQASSVMFSKKTLGVSSAYQDLASHIVKIFDGPKSKPGWGNLVFAAGIMAGAKLVSGYMPLAFRTPTTTPITTAAALTGGALFIFGARLAGGCTSGHGISGCSTLSISSLITVAAMFGGGIAFKTVL